MATHPSPLPPERPNVLRFLDARAFLAAAFEYEKGRNRAFSHRYIARVMGSTSSGFFKDILNGRVRIGPARIAAFSRLFGLSGPESDHFEALVHYTQAADSTEKERWLAKMTTGNRSRKDSILKAFQLEYFQKWHYAAVRELVAIHDFHGDVAALAASLDPPVTTAEAEDALRLLTKLKLIRKTSQGRYERMDPVIRSGSRTPERIKPAIRGNIELALRSLETHPAAQRPFSYLTLSVSEESLPLIRERLADLRRSLLDIAAHDNGADRLYQINFQMFPLSNTVKGQTP